MLTAKVGGGHLTREQIHRHAISPHELMPHDQGGGTGSIAAIFESQTVAGTGTTKFFDATEGAPWKGRVIRVWAVMTGAGAAADTVKVRNVTDGADLTNAVDVSAKEDQQQLQAEFKLNDANWGFDKGENLSTVQVSDALCRVFIECVRLADD